MVIKDDDMLGGGNIVLKSYSQQYMPGSIKQKMLAGIQIQQGKLYGFQVTFNNKKIEASCKN